MFNKPEMIAAVQKAVAAAREGKSSRNVLVQTIRALGAQWCFVYVQRGQQYADSEGNLCTQEVSSILVGWDADIYYNSGYSLYTFATDKVEEAVDKFIEKVGL
jgi:hypothetical protein